MMCLQIGAFTPLLTGAVFLYAALFLFCSESTPLCHAFASLGFSLMVFGFCAWGIYFLIEICYSNLLQVNPPQHAPTPQESQEDEQQQLHGETEYEGSGMIDLPEKALKIYNLV